MLDTNKMSAQMSLGKDSSLSGGETMKGSLELIQSGGRQTGATKKSLSAELVDSKFEQLAARILEELAQSAYSRDFFRAIDDILKEPMAKTFAHTRNNCISINKNNFNNNLQPKHYNGQVATNRQWQQECQTLEQPRSLPVETACKKYTTKPQQQQSQQRQKSAIPTMATLNGSEATKRAHSVDNRNAHAITRLATTNAEPQSLKRQQSLKESSLVAKRVEVSNQRQLVSNGISSVRKHRHPQARGPRPSQTDQSVNDRYDYNGNDQNDEDDVDDEDDDDDDDDDDEDDDDCVGGAFDHQSASKYSHPIQRFNQLTKSMTTNDAANISENNLQPKQTSNTQQSQQAVNQRQQIPQKQRQSRVNPVVRSNTISNASQRLDREREQNRNVAAKSTFLNTKDIGSLYKPHMNYSTSVLGNHRLSDDDEIIIIPTQSPSLVSTSPDGDANVDELSERFSISRTKSFWEKLSKGNPGKRSVQTPEACDNQAPIKLAQNRHDNKFIGTRKNGHAQTLDRMDSTGGSNSNYSCSSSGDENGGSHSQQGPTVRLQDISRQDRFRQTR